MRSKWKWILAGAAAVVVAAIGAAGGLWLSLHKNPQGELDTQLQGVTVSTATTRRPIQAPIAPAADRECWPFFGADPQRSLARATADLGIPRRKPVWQRGLKGYIEYPPTYCNGMLYVNTFKGVTFAIDAATGHVRWQRRLGGTMPSSPAIAGPRLIVSSQDGTVTAVARTNGRVLWRVVTAGAVESSPVVVDGLVYFGSQDGRLFAVNAASGRIRWAYNTGGRINSSPSLFGDRVCITTYAGAFFCFDRRTGTKLWSTYVKRDAFRYESFYSSPSTDGLRLYAVARSGKVVAVRASDGAVVWTQHVGGLGYTTPAVAGGRVFVGGFDGRLRAYRATTGDLDWETYVGGRILGAPVVVGNLVFVSTLEGRTFAARVSDGKVVWRIPLGQYSPGIATERTYYFSLNGRLLAFLGRHSPPPPRPTTRTARTAPRTQG